MQSLAEVLTSPVCDELSGEKDRREVLREFVFHPARHYRIVNTHRQSQRLFAHNYHEMDVTPDNFASYRNPRNVSFLGVRPGFRVPIDVDGGTGVRLHLGQEQLGVGGLESRIISMSWSEFRSVSPLIHNTLPFHFQVPRALW